VERRQQLEERLTLLTGYFASVASTLNTFIQERDVLLSQPETTERNVTLKRYEEHAINLAFVARFLLDELDQTMDKLGLPRSYTVTKSA